MIALDCPEQGGEKGLDSERKKFVELIGGPTMERTTKALRYQPLSSVRQKASVRASPQQGLEGIIRLLDLSAR